jgi:hypothetical protein
MYISSELSYARTGHCMENANTETSAHSPTPRTKWWLKLTILIYTRLSFAKSTAPPGTVHMEWDASLSMTYPKLLLNNNNHSQLQLINQKHLLSNKKNQKLKWMWTVRHLQLVTASKQLKLKQRKYRSQSKVLLFLPAEQAALETNRLPMLLLKRRSSIEIY